MEELQKVFQALKKKKIDIAVVTSVDNVTYLSGFGVPPHFGTLDCLAKGMPLVIAILDVNTKDSILLACDSYKTQIEKECVIEKKSYFSIFGNLQNVDIVKGFEEALEKAMRVIGVSKNRKIKIGIEYQSCPALISQEIIKAGACDILFDITPMLETARRIKTKREVTILKNIAHILDAGQETFNDKMHHSRKLNEFQLYNSVTSQMIKKAEELITFSGELVMGERTAEINWPGGPLKKNLQSNEIGILDISPRYKGYWGDCSNVAVFNNQPNKKQLKYFNTVKNTFSAVCEMLRPGVRCDEVTSRIVGLYEKNGFKIPHYCGHQIGASVNELPRFVPYDKSIIEEGMVFCLELGLYEGMGGDTGMRCEKMILVTNDGNEVLNRFNWGI